MGRFAQGDGGRASSSIIAIQHPGSRLPESKARWRQCGIPVSEQPGLSLRLHILFINLTKDE
jgi:hypothetical protein